MQAWRPHNRKDIDLIEGVRRRETKLISGIKKIVEERLRSVNLTTLETRRIRDNLIEVFKITKGFENLDSLSFLT